MCNLFQLLLEYIVSSSKYQIGQSSISEIEYSSRLFFNIRLKLDGMVISICFFLMYFLTKPTKMKLKGRLGKLGRMMSSTRCPKLPVLHILWGNCYTPVLI